MKLDSILIFKNAVHLRISAEKVKEIAMQTMNVWEVLCVEETIVTSQNSQSLVLIAVREVTPSRQNSLMIRRFLINILS